MVRIGVLGIDDSALSRKVLKDTLASDPECVAVGVVGSTGLALSRGSADAVDVVVLDLFLVEEDWRQALARHGRDSSWRNMSPPSITPHP